MITALTKPSRGCSKASGSWPTISKWKLCQSRIALSLVLITKFTLVEDAPPA
jgi:hypothetical protein